MITQFLINLNLGTPIYCFIVFGILFIVSFFFCCKDESCCSFDGCFCINGWFLVIRVISFVGLFVLLILFSMTPN